MLEETYLNVRSMSHQLYCQWTKSSPNETLKKIIFHTFCNTMSRSMFAKSFWMKLTGSCCKLKWQQNINKGILFARF
jgi:hypothetical protein